MLTELRNNLQSIYDQVMENLSSLNLRRNVTLLGIEGYIRQGNSFKTSSQVAIENVRVENIDGLEYGFALNDNGYYQSSNAGVNSTFSMCKLSFKANGQTELTLECINYNESNYDYGVLSNLDTELTTTIDDTANVYYSFKGKSQSGVQTVTYSVPKGEHFIYIKYRKDSSQSTNNDNFQFKVGAIGNIESIIDEVVAMAYFTEEELLADNTQIEGTVGVVIDTNGQIQKMYQRSTSSIWVPISLETVKTFSTVEEMNAVTDLAEGTVANVFGTNYVGTFKLISGAWVQLGGATEEVKTMEALNEVTGTSDEYTGMGGTEDEIDTVLDKIIGGNE